MGETGFDAVYCVEDTYKARFATLKVNYSLFVAKTRYSNRVLVGNCYTKGCPEWSRSDRLIGSNGNITVSSWEREYTILASDFSNYTTFRYEVTTYA